MKPPKMIHDLYGDLRDRRLLPVAVLLVVAIAALPLLLKTDVTPPPPSTAATDAAVAEAEDLPTLPAVLASDPGLRDYRERLEKLSKKNPFRQQFKAPESSAEVVEVTDTASGGSSGGEDISISSSGDSTEVTVGGGSGSGSGSGSGGGKPKTELVELAFRADVEVGRAGDTKRRKNVKQLTVLPSESNPVAMFIGATEDGKRAVFLVSDEVKRVHGDGSCQPRPSRCQFLIMRPGERMRFDYVTSKKSEIYALKLNDIRLVEVEDAAEIETRSAGSHSDSTKSSIQAWLGL
jgi:hypothetical protein